MSGQPVKIILKSSELQKSAVWAGHRQSECLIWSDTSAYRSRASQPSEVKKTWSHGSTSLRETNLDAGDKHEVFGGNRTTYKEGKRLESGIDEFGCAPSNMNGSGNGSTSPVPLKGALEGRPTDERSESTLLLSSCSAAKDGSSGFETPDCTLYGTKAQSCLIAKDKDYQENDRKEYDNPEVADTSLTVLVPSTPSQLEISTSMLDISIIPGTQETEMSFPSASNSLESSDILVECTPLKLPGRNATDADANLSFVPESQGNNIMLDTIYESDDSSQSFTTEESEAEVLTLASGTVGTSGDVQTLNGMESVKTIDSPSTAPSNSQIEPISAPDESVVLMNPDKQLNLTFLVSPFPMKIFARTGVESIEAVSRGPLLSVSESVEEGENLDVSVLDETFVVMDKQLVMQQELNVTFNAGAADCGVEKVHLISDSFNITYAGDPANSKSSEAHDEKPETPKSSAGESIPETEVTIKNLIPDIPRKGKKQYDLPEAKHASTPTPPTTCSSDSEIESPKPTPKRKAKIKAVRRNRDTKAELEALYNVESPKPSTSAALVRHENRIAKILSEKKIVSECTSPRSLGPSRAERMASRKKDVTITVTSPPPLSRRKRRNIAEEPVPSVDNSTSLTTTILEMSPESSGPALLTRDVNVNDGKIEAPIASSGSTHEETLQYGNESTMPLDAVQDSYASQKSVTSTESTSQTEGTETAEDTEQSTASSPVEEKRKRGRPRKNPAVAKPASETTYSVHESRPKVPKRFHNTNNRMKCNDFEVVTASSKTEKSIDYIVLPSCTEQESITLKQEVVRKTQPRQTVTIEKLFVPSHQKHPEAPKYVVTNTNLEAMALKPTLETRSVDEEDVTPVKKKEVVALVKEALKSDVAIDESAVPVEVDSDEFPIDSLEAEPLYSFEDHLGSPLNFERVDAANDPTGFVFNFPIKTPVASPKSELVNIKSPGARKLELIMSLPRTEVRDLKRSEVNKASEVKISRINKRRKNREPPGDDTDFSPPELESEVFEKCASIANLENRGKRTRKPSETRKQDRDRSTVAVAPPQAQEQECVYESSPELVRRSKRLRKPKHFGQDFFSMR